VRAGLVHCMRLNLWRRKGVNYSLSPVLSLSS
jgi:hypothetical protein